MVSPRTYYSVCNMFWTLQLGLSLCQENQITLRYYCFFSYIGCLLSRALKLKCCFFTFKAMQGLATQYLSVLLEPYSLLRSLRSASKLLHNSPLLSLRTYGYRSFSVCAPRLRNSLPMLRTCLLINQSINQLYWYIQLKWVFTYQLQ